MKNKIIFVCLFSALATFFYPTLKKMISTSDEQTSDFGSLTSTPYCLAIRGNGELAPAHWGGMSQIIERWGLPAKQAGGSSATISMMLLDAVASNIEIQGHIDSAVTREKASFLVKSFLGTVLTVQQSKELQILLSYGEKWKEFKNSFQSFQTEEILQKIFTSKPDQIVAIIQQNKEKLTLLNQFYINNKQYLNQNAFDPFFQAMNELSASPTTISKLRKVSFLSHELYQSISLFGSFNARTDDNIFFREGILDFSKLALKFGHLASFYAGVGMTKELQADFSTWINTCSQNTTGQLWTEIISQYPNCQQKLSELLISYFGSTFDEKNNFAKNRAELTIPTYPTTSVLIGKAAIQAEKYLKEYSEMMTPQFGINHIFSEPQDVRFGYWGNDVMAIQNSLPRDDEKSQRFFPLGMTTWEQVLSLSPAEPGLSRIQEFKMKDTQIYSAGGWSDLHPSLVLKASGCESVVYLQRKGGETFFGQGIAKRLFGFERSWNLLESNPENTKINNTGDPNDAKSLWGRLYNIGNSKSSYFRSIQQSDVVVCTDWNRFDLFKEGPAPMIAEAYRAPIVLNNKKSPLGLSLTEAFSTQNMSAEEKNKLPGCAQ